MCDNKRYKLPDSQEKENLILYLMEQKEEHQHRLNYMRNNYILGDERYHSMLISVYEKLLKMII